MLKHYILKYLDFCFFLKLFLGIYNFFDFQVPQGNTKLFFSNGNH